MTNTFAVLGKIKLGRASRRISKMVDKQKYSINKSFSNKFVKFIKKGFMLLLHFTSSAFHLAQRTLKITCAKNY